jgi:hypothetical protein
MDKDKFKEIMDQFRAGKLKTNDGRKVVDPNQAESIAKNESKPEPKKEEKPNE